MKHIKIRAVTGKKKVEDFDEEEDIDYYEPVAETMEVSATFFQQYGDTMQVKAVLTGCAIALVEYMAGRMNDENIIRLNAIMKRDFISLINQYNPKKQYLKASVDNALQELKQNNFVWSVGHARYQVNPVHFFKSNNGKRRIEMIKELMITGKL